ncbi:MAG: AI-2E family transporter [Oscillospiraceae bacterium]|nr:AI-2E family transporter [Oscillospiraceae bacterium]
MKKENFERAKWIPICIIAIILMVIYKTLDNFTQITTAIMNFLQIISPLLFGILFAYFLYIPHRTIERLLCKVKIKIGKKTITFISKHARVISTVIVFVLLLFIIIFILSFILPLVATSLFELASDIPEHIYTILAYFDNLPEDSALASFKIADTLREYSSDITNMISIPSFIEQAARGVISFAGGLFSLIMGLVISLYLLLDRDRIALFFHRLNNALFKDPLKRSRTVKYFSQINKVLLTFIASKGLDSIINFVVATTILLIFGVPYAPLLGLIAGVFNFIPYLGSIISALIISVLTLITCGLATGIKVMISLLVFHQLDGNFIEPRIMKSSLKVSPILVIIAVVIGGAYFGIAGMFLAVPIAVIIKQILLEYISASEIIHGDDDMRR